MTGPKELALFTAAAAMALLSGAASGQRVAPWPSAPVSVWRPGPPPYLDLPAPGNRPPGISIGGGNPYWRTGGLAGRRRRVGVPPRRYPTTRYGAAEEEEGEARRRRREGIVEEAVDTGICPLSHLTP